MNGVNNTMVKNKKRKKQKTKNNSVKCQKEKNQEIRNQIINDKRIITPETIEYFRKMLIITDKGTQTIE